MADEAISSRQLANRLRRLRDNGQLVVPNIEQGRLVTHIRLSVNEDFGYLELLFMTTLYDNQGEEVGIVDTVMQMADETAAHFVRNFAADARYK
jgi:hypothetical protein